MIIVPAERLDAVRATLEQSGYVVTEATTPAGAGLRQTQAELAAALRLPEPADRNLDAMADSLRDLVQLWDGQRVALLWQDAERLASVDGRAWWILGELLDDADDLVVVALGEARVDCPHDADGEPA